jgi:hypothetical protein
MGRHKELGSDAQQLGGKIEKQDYEIFESIALRDTKGEISELLRKAVQEYNKNHSAGNSTFKIDNWNTNPDFKVIPTLFAKPETWYQYLKECTDKERLAIQITSFRINEQCKKLSEE